MSSNPEYLSRLRRALLHFTDPITFAKLDGLRLITSDPESVPPRTGPPPAPCPSPAASRTAGLATPTEWPPGLPEVTEVQRLHLEPGDALVVKLAERLLGPADVETAERYVRAKLGQPAAQILVLGRDDEVMTIHGQGLKPTPTGGE
jgi:hypothetical protein